MEPVFQSNTPALREMPPGSMQLTRNLAGIHPAASNQDSILRDYLRVLIKRIWVVLGTLAIIFGATLIASLRATPIYDAVGSIAINKPDPILANIQNGNNNVDYSDPTTDLDTEVRILKSDLLALQVISQLNLDKLPEFGGNGIKSSSSLELTTDALQPDSARASALLGAFKGNLRVLLEPNTRIIDIHYRSPNKELAARVVNAVANTYIEQNFKTRFESTMQASDWLSRQLVDLQMKVETSQEKLVKYQKEHQILGIDDKQNITTEKLDELNKELTAAESARMEKESVYRLAESGDTDSAASIAAGMANGEGKAFVATSGLLDKLQAQKADLKIQAAQLNTQFGPAYPKIAQLNNQLQEIDIQIQSEMKKATSRLRGDYLAALQREQMLSAALEQQKQQENKMNESAIEYSFLKRDFETNRTLYEGLLQKLKEAGVTAGLRSNNIREVDIARTPGSPAEPNIPRNLGFAFVLGLTSGVGLAFLLEGIDNTVRTPEQAQAISGLASLGMIPMGSKNSADNGSKRGLMVTGTKEPVELVTQSRPQSQMAESYRALRTSLLLTTLGAPPKTILITSALPREGKTTTSINTAVVLAQKGTRVLLIDADLRRPSIHKALGLGPRVGLSNVLTGGATLQQATVRSSVLPNLYILPAGTPPPNPAELMASAQMLDLLAELREQYDHVIVDTPPTLSVTDAVVLSTRVDAVVLVIRSAQTTKPALRRSRDILAQVNARVAGVLLNAVDLDSADYYYYYEYQGKYGQRYYDENMDGSGESTAQAVSGGA
ncbi:MAG TPA: polysaccharide biosynthesis tyrosine autokinase [Terriglobales bacterium]|jgi:succinoglycan biosynthesis transport protein ExoP|nr:polysaccharide biosynthesis tyrosine autokinase [Terriglobales bacterium]